MAAATHILGPHATVTHVANPPVGRSTIGNARLFTSVASQQSGRSYVERKASKKGDISQDLMTRTQAAASRALRYAENPATYSADDDTDYSNPDTEILSGRVNFTTHTIKLRDREVCRFDQVENPQLRAQLFRISKELEQALGCNADTDPDIASNRSLAGTHPLIKPHAAWMKAHNQTDANTFITNDLPAMTETTADADKRARTAETFITKFRERLQTRYDAKMAELKLPLQADQAERRKQLRKETEQLRTLLQQLAEETLDKKAIFWALAYAKAELQGLSPDEQVDLANRARGKMQTHLGTKSKSLGSPTPTDMAAYANDVGDLLLHDRETYSATVEDRGEDEKTVSMEECIVYTIANLRNTDPNSPNESLSSLALPKAPDGIRGEVLADLREARQLAIAAHTTP